MNSKIENCIKGKQDSVSPDVEQNAIDRSESRNSVILVETKHARKFIRFSGNHEKTTVGGDLSGKRKNKIE